MSLDLAGVACSAGAACSSGSLLPSPVLRAMGRPRRGAPQRPALQLPRRAERGRRGRSGPAHRRRRDPLARPRIGRLAAFPPSCTPIHNSAPASRAVSPVRASTCVRPKGLVIRPQFRYNQGVEFRRPRSAAAGGSMQPDAQDMGGRGPTRVGRAARKPGGLASRPGGRTTSARQPASEAQGGADQPALPARPARQWQVAPARHASPREVSAGPA